MNILPMPKKNTALIHPGEILAKEFLRPLKLTPYKLGQAAVIPASRLYEIIEGRRGITPDTALRLAAALRTSPEFWLNLQAEHDLRAAKAAAGAAYRNIKALVPA